MRFKYNVRDKLDISEIIDIFTCEDIIPSHVRILYRFYQFVTNLYTADFYVIKDIMWCVTHTTKTYVIMCMRRSSLVVHVNDLNFGVSIQ